MSKRWNRAETWLALIVVVVGLLLTSILGLVAYMTTTATPLHPEPHRVPSVTHSDPSRTWAEAVDRGRQIMRAGLTEQNLPGLSVAVGVDDEIVWAEGFGWADVEKRVAVAPQTRFRIGTASKALGDQQRQAAATGHGPIAPDVTATPLRGSRRVTVLAGTSRTSNISYADTQAIGLKIAQAFAEQAKSSARK